MTIENNWMQRERTRLANGAYVQMPEVFLKLTEGVEDTRFPHPSQDDPYSWAYTPTEAHGTEDIQIRVSPKKYLSRFYSNKLTAEEITEIDREWEAQADLRLGLGEPSAEPFTLEELEEALIALSA